MNVPKWLIPVISIVAAVALGVSMAFVGANFASRTTTEVAAKTEVDPVIAPAATGLSSAEIKQLLASKTPLSSPKIGNKRVTLPGGLPAKTPLQREVERLAAGGAPGAPGAAAAADTTSTPSPAPGVVPYVPTPAPANDDPCATTDGTPPSGCPDGLHSRIFADTMPPPLNFVSTPFDARCGTSPVRVPGSSLVNVPILITTTQPATIDLGYWSTTATRRQLASVPSDPTSGAIWSTAIQANTPVADLPAIATCITVPNVEPDVLYYYEVHVHSATDGGADRTAVFDTAGPPVEQPLLAEPIGSDGLVVVGDYRTSEQLGIRAFSGAAAATTTCANASVALHELSPQEIRSFDTSAYEAAAANEPSDLVHREALGFVVGAGSTVLVCGRWFAAGTSPSWARTTPLRTSTLVVQAPDEILPHVHVEGSGIYTNPGADTVTVSVSTTEGEPCGRAAVIYRGPNGQGSRNGVLDCGLTGAGTVLAPTNFLSNIGFDGDLRITVTVLYADGHSGSHSEVLPTSETRPTSCDDSDIRSLCGHLDDLYEVGVPYYFLTNGHDPADGLLNVDVSWIKVGSTGFDQWVIEPQNVQVAPPSGDPSLSAPLLNTDNRVTAITTTGPQTVSASFDLQSNTPADYTMSLVGISGPGCAATSAPLTVHGHVDSHTTAVIPGLCFGSLYWASVTLTNAHGTTVWGHDNPSAGWLGNLLHTPDKSETLFVQETVNAGVGHIVRYVDFTIGGQEIDPTHVPASCYSSGNLSGDRHSFRLPSLTTLHIHYELRAGLRTSSGGCQLIAGTSTNPTTVDADFPINLTTLAANPAGMTITQGPVTVLIREFVDP